jgi:hypothetical protein
MCKSDYTEGPLLFVNMWASAKYWRDILGVFRLNKDRFAFILNAVQHDLTKDGSQTNRYTIGTQEKLALAAKYENEHNIQFK